MVSEDSPTKSSSLKKLYAKLGVDILALHFFGLSFLSISLQDVKWRLVPYDPILSPLLYPDRLH